MATTWIVAADSSRARILQVTDRGAHLAEVDNLLNPEGRLQDREISSDARGRWGGPNRPGGNAMEDEIGPSQHVAQAFAKRIGAYLDKARTERRYDRLCLVAPPKFLGLLRGDLSAEVSKRVAREVPKDLSGQKTRELEQQLASLLE